MTGINPNQIIYRQPNMLNHPAYGDVNAALSLDDKRLQPVKENLRTGNPIGKVVDGVTTQEKDTSFWGTVKEKGLIFTLGLIPTVIFNYTNKLMVRSDKGFEESLLGKMTKGVDNLSKRFPILDFSWAKTAYDRTLGKIGIVKDIADAPAAEPAWGMAKGMVLPNKTQAVNELLDEALELAKTNHTKVMGEVEKLLLARYQVPAEASDALRSINPKIGERYKKALENPKVAERYKRLLGIDIHEGAWLKAHQIAGEAGAASKDFGILSNKAAGLLRKESSPLSKFMASTFASFSRIMHLGSFKGGAGGKFMALGGLVMNGYFLGQTVKQTIDAPKDEKLQTLAHGLLVDFVAGWMLFEPIMRVMYKGIGALKSLHGESKLGTVLKAPLRWAGNILGIGLGMKKIAPAKGFWGKLGNGFKHTGKFGVGFLGGVGRFALVTMVLFPVVDKVARFITHGIFGKPKTLLAKEKAEEEAGKKEEAPTNKNNIEELQKALEQNRNNGMLTVAAKNANTTNTQPGVNPMIQKYMNAHVANLSSQPQAAEALAGAPLKLTDVKPELNKIPAEDDIAAASKFNKAGGKKQNYSYVPSDSRVPADDRKKQMEEQQKRAKFNATLANTDRAIKDAEKALNS